MTNLDRLEALLGRMTTKELERLSQEHLQRLADRAYQLHVWAETTAGQKPFPRVKRVETPRPEPKSGILEQLRNGRETD